MEIGLRAEALRLDPGRAFAGPFDRMASNQDICAFPGLEQLGERLVYRLARQIEDLIAGGDKRDELDRYRLLSAASLGGHAAEVELGSALVAGFGLSPAIAPLVAAALCLCAEPARWMALSRGETPAIAAPAGEPVGRA